MGYLVVEKNGQTRSMTTTSTADKPRVGVGGGYIPLVTGTTSKPTLYVNTYGSTLRLGEYQTTTVASTTTSQRSSSYGNAGTRTTTTSYYTSSITNSNGPYSGGVLSNTTTMTRLSTSGYAGSSTRQHDYWTTCQVDYWTTGRSDYDTVIETEIVGHANYYETYIDEQTSIIALRPGSGAETTYYRSITNTAQATVYSGYEAHTHQTESSFGGTHMYTHYTANFTYTDYDLSTTQYLSVNGTYSQQAYNEGADWDMRYANHNGAWNNGWYAYWEIARDFEDGVQFGNNTTWHQNGGNYDNGYYTWNHSVNGACQYVGLATLTLMTYTAHDVRTCYGYYSGSDYTYHTTIATTSSSAFDYVTSSASNYVTSSVSWYQTTLNGSAGLSFVTELTTSSISGYSGRSSSTGTQSSTQSRSSFYTSVGNVNTTSSSVYTAASTASQSCSTTYQSSSLSSGNGYRVVGGAIVADPNAWASYTSTSSTTESVSTGESRLSTYNTQVTTTVYLTRSESCSSSYGNTTSSYVTVSATTSRSSTTFA